MDVLGSLNWFWILILAIQAAAWFLLPFAIFGIKNRIDRLIKIQQKTNELLQKQLDAQSQLDMTVKVDNDLGDDYAEESAKLTEHRMHL